MKRLLTLLALSATSLAFSQSTAADHKDFTNTLGMKMIWTGSFWTSEKEVTQAQLTKMGIADTSTWRKGEAEAPANNVTYIDAVRFCQTLSKDSKEVPGLPAGFTYCLPSVSQWRSIKKAEVKDLQGSVSEWCADKFSSGMIDQNRAAGIVNAVTFLRPPVAGLYCVVGASWKSTGSNFAKGICPVHMASKAPSSSSAATGTRLNEGEIGFRVILASR